MKKMDEWTHPRNRGSEKRTSSNSDGARNEALSIPYGCTIDVSVDGSPRVGIYRGTCAIGSVGMLVLLTSEGLTYVRCSAISTIKVIG